MKRHQIINIEKRVSLLQGKSDFRERNIFSHLFLALLSLALLINPLAGQDVRNRQSAGPDVQPAYRLRGATLGDLRPAPLPARRVITSSSGIRTLEQIPQLNVDPESA